MAKEKSAVEQVIEFFQTADESAATVMVQVINQIVSSRFAKTEIPTPTPRQATRRGLKKSEANSNGAGGLRELRDHIRDQYAKEDIEKFLNEKKLNALNVEELTALQDSLVAAGVQPV